MSSISSRKRYLHFTDEKGSRGISETRKLLRSSFVPGVYAIPEHGRYVPHVQRTRLGRPDHRNLAVVFSTGILPDQTYLEEVIWDREALPIHVERVLPYQEAVSLYLKGPFEPSVEALRRELRDLELHPPCLKIQDKIAELHFLIKRLS